SQRLTVVRSFTDFPPNPICANIVRFCVVIWTALWEAGMAGSRRSEPAKADSAPLRRQGLISTSAIRIRDKSPETNHIEISNRLLNRGLNAGATESAREERSLDSARDDGRRRMERFRGAACPMRSAQDARPKTNTDCAASPAQDARPKTSTA